MKMDLTGQKFGRLAVHCEDLTNTTKNRRWICECDCGKTTRAYGIHLRRRATKSCGCLRSEMIRNRVYEIRDLGRLFPRAYMSWKSMLQRCRNPRHKAYKYYGGRGIKASRRWNKFKNFLADMGDRPVGLTLDRVFNDGNYERSNCRWATRQQQATNRKPRGKNPPSNCKTCGRLTRNRSHGRCQTCRAYFYNHGFDRSPELIARNPILADRKVLATLCYA